MYLFWTRLPATGRNISFLCSKKLEVYSFGLRQFHASISGNVNRLKVKKKETNISHRIYPCVSEDCNKKDWKRKRRNT